MQLERQAALGATRGAGESLLSWLTAGPLGARAASQLGDPDDPTFANELAATTKVCPRCKVATDGRIRWYSRAEWNDPRWVVCAVHAEPLIPRPAHDMPIRSHTWPQSLRNQFRELGTWLPEWTQPRPYRDDRRGTQPNGTEEAVMHCLSSCGRRDLGVADAILVGQWSLWMQGWPVRPYPGERSCASVSDIHRQGDRLALVAVTWKVCRVLHGAPRDTWPLLPVSGAAYDELRMRLCDAYPEFVGRVPLAFERVSG